MTSRRNDRASGCSPTCALRFSPLPSWSANSVYAPLLAANRRLTMSVDGRIGSRHPIASANFAFWAPRTQTGFPPY